MRLGTDGRSWQATYTEGGSDAGSWNATAPVWRPGKGTTFVYKDKDCFDRLCKPKVDRNEAWYREHVKSALATSMGVKRILVNGVLSESLPNCIGDPYKDPPKVDPRMLGRNIQTAITKKGTVGAGCFFSEEVPNAVGDSYPTAEERLAKKKKAVEDLKLPDRPVWKPASERVVREDAFLLEVDATVPIGTLREKAKSQKELASRPRDRGEIPTRPRPILTKPGAKGGPGVVGTLLGHATEEGREILSYTHDPFDAPQEEHKAFVAREREILGDKRPFSAHVPGGRSFSKNAEMYHGLGPGDGRPRETRTFVKVGDKPPFKPGDGVSRDCAPRAPYMSDPLIEAKFKRGDNDNAGVRWKPGAVGSGVPLAPTVRFARKNVVGMTREALAVDPSFKAAQQRTAKIMAASAPSRPSSGAPEKPPLIGTPK